MSRRSFSLTQLFVLPVVVAGLLGSLPGSGSKALAQTSGTAKIPFTFSAGHHDYAAGSYRFELMSDRFLCLRRAQTMESQCLMIRPEVGRAIETQGRLVFHRDGGSTYLQQVWMAGTNVHSELAARPKARRALARGSFPETLTAGSPIEVALR